MHESECGAACLGSVLAYFGRWVPLTELRTRCEVSRDGASAAGIKRAAQHYGLKCVGRSVQLHKIRKMSLPIIVFWEFNHFLIVEGYDGNRFFLNDPRAGRLTMTEEEFNKGFTGIALEFEPGSNFRSSGTRPNLFQRLPHWLEGTLNPLTIIVLCGIMLIVPALLTPALLAVFVDHVLLGSEAWSIQLAIALIAAAGVSYILMLLKHRWLHRLESQLSVIAGDRCISQMLRLPIEFFNHRFVGDLISRILSIDRIAQGLSVQIIELLIKIISSTILLIVMLVVSPILALVVLGLTLLSVLLTNFLSRRRFDKSFALRREQGLLFSVGTLMLNQSETVRMTATGDRFFSRWSGHQARELNARQSLAELNHINSSLPELFKILIRAAVLVIGGIQVISGDLTLGTLVGFFFLASMFLSPVGDFVEFVNQRQVKEADLQRLDDIVDTSIPFKTKAQSEHPQSVPTLKGRLKLTGNIELCNISFGYNRSRKPMLKDFNLTIEPGKRVAIVGPSGSGKSTLARIVAGLYEPWTGEVLFDSHLRASIPPEVLSRSISVVEQDINLFTANVRENITLWNPSIPEETVVAAARDAGIHNEIINRPMGYETLIAEGGGNFSGGQKQRIQIARALATEPVILILDEATSALDAATEEFIDSALRRRGVSCLIVAHRLSTIRDCDEIIVLNKGVEVQRGSHDELILDEDGLYYQLVRAD